MSGLERKGVEILTYNTISRWILSQDSRREVDPIDDDNDIVYHFFKDNYRWESFGWSLAYCKNYKNKRTVLFTRRLMQFLIHCSVEIEDENKKNFGALKDEIYKFEQNSFYAPE